LVQAKFADTNLIARDWRKLAAFVTDGENNLIELQSWAPVI
jgi:hypothetical protein